MFPCVFRVLSPRIVHITSSFIPCFTHMYEGGGGEKMAQVPRHSSFGVENAPGVCVCRGFILHLRCMPSYLHTLG